MKFISSFIVVLGVAIGGWLSIPLVTLGQENGRQPVIIEMFERQDCAHCQAEKRYLETLASQKNDVEVRLIDINSETGKALFDQFTEAQKLSKATPITVIGATVLQGFDSERTTGKQIEKLIEVNRGKPFVGIEGLLSGQASVVEQTPGAVCDSTTGICTMPTPEPLFVTLPFTDITFDAAEYSLPVLSGVLGLIDGFNPCAMWVLVTFLIVLVQMGSRKRMWIVAGLFILAESIMYYLILNVWFTAWDFVGLDRIVTPIVGAVAIGGGLFFLYEWYTSDGTCQVVDLEGRAKISGRIKKLASEPFTWLTAVGIIALAFSVNVIEFACSI
ncbi:MAG TPA: glutaredoxin, partial [Patescibacteria group bacterium]|nr:glutaredoxin [Patescibacteria group bacterium]